MNYESPGLKLDQETDYMKDDVYALGISLFKMVTKCYPFGRGSANIKLFKAFQKNQENFWQYFEKKLNNEEPYEDDFKDLINKMLEVD